MEHCDVGVAWSNGQKRTNNSYKNSQVIPSDTDIVPISNFVIKIGLIDFFFMRNAFAEFLSHPFNAKTTITNRYLYDILINPEYSGLKCSQINFKGYSI